MGNAIHIVAGDFNEGKCGGAYKLLLTGGWQNALDASRVSTTWEWPLMGPFMLWGSYDHVFYSPERISLASCNVGTEFSGASDHLPVTAIFETDQSAHSQDRSIKLSSQCVRKNHDGEKFKAVIAIQIMQRISIKTPKPEYVHS